MKFKKETWGANIVGPQHCADEEMNLWIRDVDGFPEINPLNTTLNCICGNHPWTITTTLDPRISNTPVDAPNEPDASAASSVNVMTVAGPPRTGSTLVFNAVGLIIQAGMAEEDHPKDDLLFKTHELFESRCPLLIKQDFIFYCIRNPFDSLYSYLRLNNVSYEEITESSQISQEWYNKIFTDVKLARIHSDLYHNRLTRTLFMPKVERPLLIVPYEEYWNKEKKLIEDLSKVLQIKLTEEQKQEIYSKINIELAKNVSDDLKEGESYNGLHHAHIGDQKGAPGQGAHLPRFIKDDIIEKFGNIYNSYGYKLQP